MRALWRWLVGKFFATYVPPERLAIPTADIMSEYEVEGGPIWGVVAVGSRATCDPPPSDTDEDYLCKAESLKLFKDRAEADGFEYGGSDLLDEHLDGIEMRFISLRRGHVNLIVTDDDEFYRRFLAASSVAKRFNLLRKDDRVALFQAVLYGNECGGFPDNT
jgi:hypothetical protein